jgi:hypothetical protein
MPSLQRRALLLGATSLTFSARQSFARAGVVGAVVGPGTSPGSGACSVPPPGIDVEVGQTITTCDGEIVNLLLADGTSVTVGPQSTMRIDRCVFDVLHGKAELALTLGSGTCHMICGAIGRSGEITLATPAGSIGVHDAIATFSVMPRVTLGLVSLGRAREIAPPAASHGSLRTIAHELGTIVRKQIASTIVATILMEGPAAVAAWWGAINGEAASFVIDKLQTDLQKISGEVDESLKTEMTRAFDNALPLLRPLPASMMAQHKPSGFSQSVERAMANGNLAMPDKHPIGPAGHTYTERGGFRTPGNFASPQPAVVQRVSAAISNRPYQGTIQPRQ